MSQAPTCLQVVAFASTAPKVNDTTIVGSLFVVSYPGEENERIYWNGQRLPGATVDHTQLRSNSISDTCLTMLIDGQRVAFGARRADDHTFEFRGATLYVHGGAGTVGYDSATDQLIL